MARRRPSRSPTSPRPKLGRISREKILDNLRVAGRKGDPTALALAIGEMRTLAQTPRYWEKYLGLLRNPLARVVDLLVIKQGERIAHLKGWKKLGSGTVPTNVPPPDPPRRQPHRSTRRSSTARRPPASPTATQPSLFEP
jgi:hypothetical protein